MDGIVDTRRIKHRRSGGKSSKPQKHVRQRTVQRKLKRQEKKKKKRRQNQSQEQDSDKKSVEISKKLRKTSASQSEYLNKAHSSEMRQEDGTATSSLSSAIIPEAELEEINYLEENLGVRTEQGRQVFRREMEMIGLGDMDRFLDRVSTSLGIDVFSGAEGKALQDAKGGDTTIRKRESKKHVAAAEVVPEHEREEIEYLEEKLGVHSAQGRKKLQQEMEMIGLGDMDCFLDGLTKSMDLEMFAGVRSKSDEDENKFTEKSVLEPSDLDAGVENNEDSDFEGFVAKNNGKSRNAKMHRCEIEVKVMAEHDKAKKNGDTADAKGSAEITTGGRSGNGYAWDESSGEKEEERKGNVNVSEFQKNAKLKNSESSVRKYVPPHIIRNQMNDDEIKAQKCKRQLNGLTNKLSYENIQPISSQIRTMYASISSSSSTGGMSRRELIDVLTSLLLKSCVEFGRTHILHSVVEPQAALVAGLHQQNLSNVGATVVEAFVVRLDEMLRGVDTADERDRQGHALISDKGPHNLVLFLACLYNFRVVFCGLIYDIIRRLLSRLSELDIELLLIILKTCGWRLREDDPSALRDIIKLTQQSTKRVNDRGVAAGEKEGDARLQVLLDKIFDLKNNKRRKTASEDLDKRIQPLKSWLAKFSDRGNVELQVGLEDFMNVSSKGRWWLTGAAWSTKGSAASTDVRVPRKNEQSGQGPRAPDNLMYLATEMRMNTALRKSIFCVIMGANDYLDAYEKILRLKLSTVQAREVIRVLIHCCSAEEAFNPYYGYLANKLCSSHRTHKFTTQLVYWDLFKRIESDVTSRKATNLALLLAQLITSYSVSLSIFKVVDFDKLGKVASIFFYAAFRKILDAKENVLVSVFSRIGNSIELSSLRDGIWYFFQRYLLVKSASSKFLSDKEKIRKKFERAELRRRIKLAMKAMGHRMSHRG